MSSDPVSVSAVSQRVGVLFSSVQCSVDKLQEVNEVSAVCKQ